MTRRTIPPTIADPAALNVLAGGGEMGARMRAFDWARTSLGEAERWPRSLQTAVRIMLTSRQPMFVWWGDDLLNLYNDAYKAIAGGKHPGALGQPAAEVWHEIWPQIEPRAYSAMRTNEGTYDEALLLIMERNGYPEETYYTFSYSPVPNDEGGTGGIICANTDDTRRIMSERQLALLRELASRTTDARTFADACTRSAASLASNAHDLPFAMIYLVDAERRRVVLTGTAGISRDHPAVPETVALDGRSVWPFAEVVRSHRAVSVTGLGRRVGPLPCGAWERPPSQAVLLPIAASGQSGRAGVLVAGLNPYRLFDDDYRGFLELVSGQIAASVGNASAYEEERRRAEALAEIDRAKTAFFSNVSHEFRTPLTLMLGPTEDALASPEPSLRGAELRTVHRNELRLLKLVNSLLDFARIEAGRAEASYRKTDLSALTADLASAFRSAIERAGLVFEVDTPTLVEPIFVDHEMWEKIVLNLLSNALKFTFEGKIRVALGWKGDRVELVVADTGSGIPVAEVPRLFERFHRIQGARARTHEGSGIGLALVHELVRLHGGRIEVKSELDRGTTFTVSIPRGTAHLPAERVDATSILASTALGAAPFVEEALRWLPSLSGDDSQETPAVNLGVGPRRAAPAQGTRILVVDDNADMREYLRRILSERWTVEAATDGEAALEAVRRRSPDLVLTDVMMPRLDGFGLIRELRGDPVTANVGVIMLSARAGEESRVEGLRAGADDYLVKPFSARELIAHVETQLSRAELRRVQEQHARRLATIFANAPVGICLLHGPEHVYELANADYLRVVGERDVVGKTVRQALPELAGQGFYERLDEVYRSGEPYVGRSLRLVLAPEPGSAPTEGFFDFVFQPLFDEKRQVEGILVVTFEVTDLARARREAEAASRAKDEFLAMLGHELRNPLAPITTALHLMRLRGEPALERERTVIERQVTHLTQLVDDLLDVSRIARGKIELRRRLVELSEIVAKAIEMSSPLLEQRQHRLHLFVPSRGLIIDGDVVRLAQVVANLLTNAAKYTESGGDITIDSRRDRDRVVLRVSDTGIGIASELLPRVFESFVQGHQPLDRSQGGLGLGLAIVRSFVRLHGGSVTVQSGGKGKGSTFTVDLPLARGASEPARSRTVTAPLDLSILGRQTGLRILVVDDNEDAAETLAEALGTFGHDVRIAHDGPEALRIADDFGPHVALLDIGLPVMDGYELAQRLRRDRGPNRPRLLAVTGYGQEADRRRAEQAGFDALLVKPVRIRELETELERYRFAGQANTR